jgi:hypothetical protein
MTLAKNPDNTRHKDPSDDGVVYTLNWAQFLGDDTISTSVWTLPDDDDSEDYLEIIVDSHTSTSATIELTKGVADTYYELKNTIVTAGGATFVKGVWIKVGER